MTQAEDDKNENPSAPQPEEDQQGKTADQIKVSDKDVQDDGTGKHGRPTDDSDPGHS